MIRQWAGLVGGLILACSPLATLDASELLPAVDLRAESARAAQAGTPLIVLYSRRDCAYCAAVRRDYLQPLAADPRYRGRLLIRQINQDGDAQSLIDFRGATTTHARFAGSEQIKLVPVVAFYGPDGRQLTDAIVGTRLPDFYPSYLEEALEQSRRALKVR